METPADRLLDAHPHAGPAWFVALARVAGGVLTLPGLRHSRPLAQRVGAVTQAAGRVTVLNEPWTGHSSRGSSLTVLCANLWHDWPRRQRWPERLESFARLAEAVGADILLVQEVARTAAMKADLWLADRLGLSLAYARANGDLDAIGFEEGPAILSRFPLGEVHLRQLTHGHNPFVRRVALAAEAETTFGGLLLVTVHLGLIQRHNAGQIRRLRSWVADVSGDRAAVIAGDFNAPEHRSEITATRRQWTDTFRELHPEVNATTHTRVLSGGRLLHRRLDYVFVQQPPIGSWRVLESAHLDAPGGPHSDHRAVFARLSPATPDAPSSRGS